MQFCSAKVPKLARKVAKFILDKIKKGIYNELANYKRGAGFVPAERKLIGTFNPQPDPDNAGVGKYCYFLLFLRSVFSSGVFFV